MQQKVRFHISGMTCQACASRIEKVLNKKDFVQTASVNFASEEAQVVFDNSRTDAAALAQIITQAGFNAQEKTPAAPLPSENHTDWRLWLLLAVNVPFLIGMAGMMVGHHDWMMPALWQFALASVVQLWLAVPFYKSAWASIKGGLANMDVLVTIGTAAIYLYSVWMMFRHGGMGHHGGEHVYFEAGVMVVGFVSLGKFLEHRTKKSSLDSLGLLLKLTPRQVNVERGGQWQHLPLDQVQAGDLIRAGHGERIAADGIVESGSGWADESHLTGESQPEAKTAGSKVLAGAMITDGSMVYRALRLGSQTLLGDMMAALSEAQGSKAPIARVADKAAAVFVPAVVGIAALTFILTWLFKGDWIPAMINAVAVLVIACPCALGLATPAAIMAGMGKAAKHGIWFKDAAAMEAAARVNVVVLDKTGTLTEGRPEVAAVYLRPFENLPGAFAVDENELYRLAASVGQNAAHPLARAIVQTASARGITLPLAGNVHTEAGAGVKADIDGIGEVKIGKPDYCGLTLPKNLGPVWKTASIVAVSANGRALGAFALADRLKADSKQAVGRLKAHGIKVYMMSGDNQGVADYIAAQLGISRAFGNMSPRGKAAEVQKLKAAGNTVAMVGDGINDAPALAAADVGFAMKNGADIAEHTASATLMQHSANQMVDALLISRATLTNIKQNLFFAFFYNISGIPLAALGLLSPVVAGAAMALSSISVLGNALRLKRVKIDGSESR
ncbi:MULTISPECIES: cation-translocating P-type ATPase [unclassified Neisseria]|uniref:heavy metal translocating P-type ATPase n=1 Tax=unclassified Neisseria TaxID=2623750 RepID=UPI001071E2F6|nr:MULTISPECIES: heavy metal translocating P-type ATPase [unclassified Neisseria]MBF0804154.1 copper-translocating P-type ATPase [Neisseria sp. 19428wB4_WF04]TFU43111.1 copper-translocating P-type ATPase [Neisseria sp. WF04]